MRTPILSTMAALRSGRITAKEATAQLKMLGAADWLISSVADIERYNREQEQWLGPMGGTVRKIQGAA